MCNPLLNGFMNCECSVRFVAGFHNLSKLMVFPIILSGVNPLGDRSRDERLTQEDVRR
jgi:hypothetical protein